jgi:hypothetical protein
METSVIKHKLHQYIDESDDQLLKLMYALAREYRGEIEGDVSYEISREEILKYEERQKKRVSGASKTYNWQAAKAIITSSKTI